MNYTLSIVLLGTSILGIVSASLGSFAVLRRQSLLGDAMSHAALPGICLAFILTWSKSPLILLTGALFSGWVGTLLLSLVTDYTHLKKDAALGIVLSVFFGFGLVLLTYIQRLPTANKSGLNSFLFGSASTLLIEDVYLMFILSVLILILLWLFWKEIKLLCFDPDFAKAIGYPVKRLDLCLTSLIVLSIVIGLQSVGVVLMSAMVIAPAVAARQWTDRLGIMVIIAAVFGSTSAIIGAVISSLSSKMPTGPTIVVVMSSIVLISLLFASNRGLVWGWIRHYRNRKRIRFESMLTNMMLFSESQTDPFHPHDIAALHAIGKSAQEGTIKDLLAHGLIYEHSSHCYGLTPKGLKKAKALLDQRQEENPDD